MATAARVSPHTFFSQTEWADLTARSSWRGIALVAHCWLCIALVMACGARWPWTIPAGVLLIGNRQLGLLILMHDAAHGLLHSSRKLNDWIGTWLCGSELPVYRLYHLQHHRFVQQAEDPDLVLSAPFPVSRASLLRKIVRDLSGQTFFRQHIGDVLRSIRVRAPGMSRWHTVQSAAYQQRLFLLFNGSSFFLFCLAGQGRIWLALWLLPMITWLPLITRVRNIAEHALLVPNASDPLQHARTTNASLVARLLVAPYWVNYHCEHHLFTPIPCWNLPRAHCLLVSQGVTSAMPAQPGYLAMLRSAAPVPHPVP